MSNRASVLSFSGEIPLGKDAPLIGFTVDIYDGPLHTSGTAHKVATSSFQFNNNCVLERYFANDLTIPPDRNDDTIRGTVNSHPEWSDNQIVAFLKEKDAKYGPSDRQAFMRSLSLAPLELLLGKLEVKDVRFKVASEVRVGDFAELEWVVDALAKKRGYTTEYYRLRFNSFDGRLVSILRIPGPYKAEKSVTKN